MIDKCRGVTEFPDSNVNKYRECDKQESVKVLCLKRNILRLHE